MNKPKPAIPTLLADAAQLPSASTFLMPPFHRGFPLLQVSTFANVVGASCSQQGPLCPPIQPLPTPDQFDQHRV